MSLAHVPIRGSLQTPLRSTRPQPDRPVARSAEPREFPVWPTIAAATALGLLYWPAAVELIQIWSIDPNSSHGFAVPFFSLYLAWSAARQAQGPLIPDRVDRGDVLRGVAKVVFGLTLHLIASFVGHLFLDVAALLCILRGLLLVVGGRDTHDRFGLAVFFLIFMARLPLPWHQALARQLQELVGIGSAYGFELFGVPVHREGYLLHLPGCTLTVGEACSGMRQITTTLALSVVIGFFTKRSNPQIALLAAAGLPLAVVANCLRVISAGFMIRWVGDELAGGVLHDLEGVATMGLVSLLLLGTARLLARYDRPAESSRDADATPTHGLDATVGTAPA